MTEPKSAAGWLIASPASRQETLREWARANTCSEVHEGTLCSVCRYAGVGCVRAWALNEGAADKFEQMDARIKADVQRDELDHD